MGESLLKQMTTLAAETAQTSEEKAALVKMEVWKHGESPVEVRFVVYTPEKGHGKHRFTLDEALASWREAEKVEE